MWVYFNASMVAAVRVFDTPIRQGDTGDELFVVFENYVNFANKFVTLQIGYPNGTLSAEVFFTIPSSKQFVLPTTGAVGDEFTNGITYIGANYIFADNSWFEQFGIHKITVRVYDDVGGSPGAVETTGLFNFNVETSVFTPNPDVSLVQYQYLLAQIQGLIQPNFEDKVIYFVRNDEASQLTVGTAVYVSGTTGASGILKVKRASASIGVSQPNKIFGVVVDPIAVNANGYVVIMGLVGGINTSAFSAGENVFLGTSPGTLVATAPASPNHRIIVGIAERINASTGSIYVRIQMGLDLNELCDVNTAGVINNSVIRYNSSTGVWVVSSALTTVESALATAETNIVNVTNGLNNHIVDYGNPHFVTKAQVGLGNVDNTSDVNKPISTATQTVLSVKADLVAGKIPSNQLPSYVDDVLEFANLASFPAVGEADKLYIDVSTNAVFRWTGSVYAVVSSMLALGETEFSAYRGDRGKIAFDHSQIVNGTNPHQTTFENILNKPTTLNGYGINDALNEILSIYFDVTIDGEEFDDTQVGVLDGSLFTTTTFTAIIDGGQFAVIIDGGQL